MGKGGGPFCCARSRTKSSLCAVTHNAAVPLPLTVSDLRAKVQFGQPVKMAAIKPNYGRWRWRPTQPRPAWNALRSAAVWRAEQFSTLRASLAKPPVAVQATSSADPVIPQLQLQSPSDPSHHMTLTIYDALEPEVPAAINTINPRAAIVLVEGTDWVAPQIVQVLETVPVMMFGATEDVQRVYTNVKASHG